ncbi:MAG: hypothetical protein K6G58_04610 [Lachnospiraceae bacterium]|nr:hypothetical protein [Lachnospiraceae bacterium]
MRTVRRGRRAVSRGFKKALINIIFAPARIPKIKEDTVDMLMRLCEGSALVFAALLVAHIALPGLVHTPAVVICGAVFIVLLAVIKLSDYQHEIEKYRYYGFRI